MFRFPLDTFYRASAQPRAGPEEAGNGRWGTVQHRCDHDDKSVAATPRELTMRFLCYCLFNVYCEECIGFRFMVQ